jgi:hypothetical protein
MAFYALRGVISCGSLFRQKAMTAERFVSLETAKHNGDQRVAF